MKKVIKYINALIMIILIILLICICYLKFVKKSEIITLFGKGFLVIVTESMSPTIESGEFVIISKEKLYEEGDIVTYLDKEDMIVTHRIKNINNGLFVAKGDNNNISDEEIGLERIYGRVIFKSKIIGIFILYFLKPVILIYVIYLIISEIVSINKFKEIEECKENENKNNILEEEKCLEEK